MLTGAARGIGLATARECLEHGAHVFVTDIDEAALAKAQAKVEDFGNRLRLAKVDVADRNSIVSALRQIEDWPQLDGLINNAALLDISDSAAVDDVKFSRVLDINLTGALRVTQSTLELLRRSDKPSIVNTISTQSFWGIPRSAAYASAKGGLLMLTRSMAVDFGADNIRVNAVAPGFIDTQMALMEDGSHEHDSPDFCNHYIKAGRIPLRRPGKPEDCAGAFIFLLSDMSRYITGQVVFVDGGLSATY